MVAVVVLASGGVAGAAPIQRDTQMKTVCVGRFLIDVPSGTRISPGYVYAKKNIQTTAGVSVEDFRQRINARGAALSAKRHRMGGAMSVSETRIDDDAVLLTSWVADSSRAGHRQELYVLDRAHGVQYLVSGDTDAAKLPAAIENYRALRPRISYRRPESIPATAGFCIDSGFIAGNRINSEEMTIGLRPREYPGVRMTLMSYVTGKPDRPLLQRSADLPPEYAAAQARMRNLRRGERNVGPIAGQEILAHAESDGSRMYAFLWESQGRAESLQFPFLSLQLLTEETEAGATAFRDDAQALDVWDRVLGSLRLRPGAI
ncbi:T6SS immunity protein Tli4 family protein [Stenotrophomonas sp. Iso1]|uniref:T6SS immunity protein Tli4 family protein n=1 Tax=Stenotrophomonas sp. Iso1 TaxID=2977283 RepID=UPI0022B7D59D|nr:T6SS immunity protein Tli4 family protein [Stenotrophomonas sp. Iso1]